MDYELNELKREFLVEALQKVLEMQSALDGGCDSGTLDRLGYLAHQLKGSGGSYGYARISSDAAAIEDAIEQTAGGGSLDAVSGKIRQHVLNMRTEIEKNAQELAGAA